MQVKQREKLESRIFLGLYHYHYSCYSLDLGECKIVSHGTTTMSVLGLRYLLEKKFNSANQWCITICVPLFWSKWNKNEMFYLGPLKFYACIRRYLPQHRGQHSYFNQTRHSSSRLIFSSLICLNHSCHENQYPILHDIAHVYYKHPLFFHFTNAFFLKTSHHMSLWKYREHNKTINTSFYIFHRNYYSEKYYIIIHCMIIQITICNFVPLISIINVDIINKIK